MDPGEQIISVKRQIFQTALTISKVRMSMAASKPANLNVVKPPVNSLPKPIPPKPIAKSATTSNNRANVKNNNNFVTRLSFRKKNSTPRVSIRVLSGTVKQILQWPVQKRTSCYIEVIAYSMAIKVLRNDVQMVLRDRINSGPTLTAVVNMISFMNDNLLSIGKQVRCVGKIMKNGTMRVFKIRQTNDEEVINFDRISYVCSQYGR